MTDFATLLQQGNAWLFLPSAIALGALHGLEPGHSKTMMAAFIVAIRGTMRQAVLLGLSATLSHTVVVWAVAMAGLYFGRNWDAATSEPYFQIVSGVLIVGVGAWMLWRTGRNQWLGDARHAHEHEHDHVHHHEHSHDHDHAHAARHDHVHSHDHDNRHAGDQPMHQDAHEKAHADAIRRRFTGRDVTTGQVVLFGLTGGLIPCPASITVLLLCLHLKKAALGATLVLGFSIGLALTLVASGALAALGVRHATRRWNGLGEFARKAPYLSGIVIVLVGLYVIHQAATASAA
ncbi:nickel/cobalt efflux transporter [Achromobacter aloeverae]